MAVGAFVVMFWNVENFFDPFDDPMKNDEEFIAGAERHWSWPRFEAKRDGIAQTVMASGDIWGEMPALVGLAEVENRMVVSQLVRKTPLGEMGYGYVHRESPDGRGIDVALLYKKDRFRVVAVDSLRIPGTITRDILYVKGVEMPGQAGHDKTSQAGHDRGSQEGYDIGGRNWRDRGGEAMVSDTVHVFVVHFPSKRGGERGSAGRRVAAMQVLESAVDSLLGEDPRRRIIVMGDFNDTDCSVKGLSEPPEEQAQEEGTVSGETSAGKSSAGKSSAVRLMADKASAGKYMAANSPAGTIKYHGRWETIDHFFVSQAAGGVMRIFAPSFLLEPDKAWLGVKPRRTYVGPRYNGGLSDHLPICFRLD